jgi:hypothetical protein
MSKAYFHSTALPMPAPLAPRPQPRGPAQPARPALSSATLLQRVAGLAAPSAETLGRLFTREELQFLAFKHGFAGVLSASDTKPRFAAAVAKLLGSGRLAAPAAQQGSEGAAAAAGQSSSGSLPQSSPYFGLEEDSLVEDTALPPFQQDSGEVCVDLSEEEGGEEGGQGAASSGGARGGGSGMRGWGWVAIPDRSASEAGEEARLLAALPATLRELYLALPEGQRRQRAVQIMEEGGGLAAMEAAAASAREAAKAGAGAGAGSSSSSSSRAAKRKRGSTQAPLTAEVGVQWSPRVVVGREDA